MTRIIPTGQRQDDRCGQRVRGGEDRGTEDGTERQQGQRQGSHCRQCRRQGGDPHGSRRRDGKQRRQQGQERDGGSLEPNFWQRVMVRAVGIPQNQES